jgi:predicted DNA-binding antitoxin AbrB/MazE fold protein
MGHKIAEAIIENGVLKYVNKKLPSGKINVHIIYDESKEVLQENETQKIVKETSAIYKNINVEVETRKLRDSWERNVRQ